MSKKITKKDLENQIIDLRTANNRQLSLIQDRDNRISDLANQIKNQPKNPDQSYSIVITGDGINGIHPKLKSEGISQHDLLHVLEVMTSLQKQKLHYI